MPEQDAFSFGDCSAIQTDFHRVLMTAFCRALDASGCAPLDVLDAMAGALGSVYRQVAEHHRGQSCPCGWQPAPAEDIEMLQAAFRDAAKSSPASLLLAMQVLGRA
jgi:hypothetical protein